MQHQTLELRTPDGVCPTHIFHPDGEGPWPAVIVYMDGIGMRPAIVAIAARIAASGYYVAAPNLFYRVGYNAEHGVNVFSDPKAREDLVTRILPSATTANVMRDTDALLAHLAAEPRANDDKIGITGYCMGGRLSIYAAGHYGDRVAAAASYHGSRMATDAPDSPHALAPRIRARLYIAGAIEDAGFDDAQKALLERTLTEANVDHVVTTYNARHGWVPADTPVHDPVEAERHWESLLTLFGQTLAA